MSREMLKRFARPLRACGGVIIASLLMATASAQPALSLAATTQPSTRPATAVPTTAPSSTQATSQPVRPEVDAAIIRLSASDWKTRQRAEEELIALGDDALPRLQQLADHAGDPEVHSRAQAAMRAIEDRRLVGQSIVTLHLHDVVPSVLFAELARQGHTEFGLWPASLWTDRQWPKISIDADRIPFWAAVQESCSKVGLQLQPMGNDRKLNLTQGGNWMAGPSNQAGPFMVIARTIHRSNSVDLTQPQNVQHDFNVTFYIFPEPKLRVLQTSYDVKLTRVVDDKGNSLLPGGPWADNLSSASGFPLNMTARLAYPANAGTRIAQLKGTARTLVQVRSEVVEIPDIATARNVSRNFAGRSLLIKQMRKQGEQYTVETVVSRGSLSQTEWEQFRNPQGQIKLIDAHGKALSSRGWGGGGSDQQMEMNLEFGRDNFGGEETRPGEPVKLIWEITTESREISVPIEFNDLPLP